MRNTTLLFMLLAPIFSLSQSVGIGTQSPNQSAMLDVNSTQKGLLIPRMSENQKNQISNPATGLLIWQTDGTPGFYYNGGTPEGPKWYMLSVADDSNWKLTGNSNIDSALHFLGSTNKAPVYFKARNTWAGQLDSGKATFFGFKAGWQAPHHWNTAFGTEALSSPSEAYGNTAIGTFAALNNRSGDRNTAVGTSSLFANITGHTNTSIGFFSMLSNVSGNNNTALGAFALYLNDTGTLNTALGAYALNANKSWQNTAVGSSALRFNTTGFQNTALGRSALGSNTIGSENTAVGQSALFYNTSGNYNNALGDAALFQNTTGSNNTAIGRSALRLNTTGNDNVAVGNYTLVNGAAITGNTAIGNFALEDNIAAEGNTALGYQAARKNTSGEGITAVGFNALPKNTTGNNNTALGGYSLFANTTGYGNTAIGKQTLFSNTIGIENVAVGNFTLANLTTQSGNTAIGHNALEKNTAAGNTAVGHDAARENTTAFGTTAMGYDALKENTTGNLNTALGWGAGTVITTGNGNTFLGYGANANVGTRFNANAIGTRSFVECSNCLVLGSVAGVNGATSSVKVGIGTTSPFRDLTLNSNVFGGPVIGFEVNNTEKATVQFEPNSEEWRFTNQADGRMIFRTGNTQLKLSALGTVTIGPSAMVGPYTLLVSDNDKDPMIQFQKGATDKGFLQIVNDDIKIGTNVSNDNGNFFVRTNGTDRMIVTNAGLVGIGTSNPAYRLQVGTMGDGSQARANAWNTFSDERYKTDIVSIDHALEKLDRIGGYYYHWKSGEDKSRQAGLLAQEVEKVLPEIVSTDPEGYKSVDYGKMNALLVQAVKEQHQIIGNLVNELKALKKQIENVESQNRK